ncbi:GDP-mannose-dependent monoacylated alpha-(1-6)-phosphatidylinositol monomannoside mannosyltransferase [invertebrate metagenome]|uniref:GDP-mannose-dependent monoacylated alpha-(1-6)-phosphatidylinositol monomannoside mannosyltransferase n=1 Tax=invertebrate metagenome TaxID=1711999 RepID=A0A2H9T4B3_9ZZZZ
MYVLQLCHGYGMPFHYVARQYARLFKGSPYRVITVFLTGEKNETIAKMCESHAVFFLENSSKDLRGLKRHQIAQVRKLYRQWNFSFAIAHRYKSLYIASHINNLFVFGVQHAFGGYHRWSRRWYVKQNKRKLILLGVSDAIRDDMRRSLPKLGHDRIHTLYNCIDYEQLRQNLVNKKEARNILGLPKDAYVFGNVGRLHPDKDQETLLRAFARCACQLPDAMVVIVGKGRLEQKLKDLAEELHIRQRVIFTGVIENAAHYFKAFDAFVLTSDHEPFGMVLLEAMVAGVPVAACNTGGAPEIVGNAGEVFGLRDDQRLSQVMIKYYDLDSIRKQEITDKGTQRVIEYFSEEPLRKDMGKFIQYLQVNRNES